MSSSTAERAQTGEEYLGPAEETLISQIDARGVTVSQEAARHYVEAHPEATGSAIWQAREQIRGLLADMLNDDRTLWEVSGSGLLVAVLKGYTLVITPNGEAVVSYKTRHAFRTWQQVKAGVPSPVGKEREERRIRRCVEFLVELARSAGATVQREEGSHTLVVAGPGGRVVVQAGFLSSRRKVYAAGAVISTHVGLQLEADPGPAQERPPSLREGWLVVP